MRFEGQVAMVTGAASGIGRAVALRLAAEGAAVAAVDVNGPGAEEVAAQVRRSGARALAVPLDVRRVEEIPSAVEAIERELGPLTAQVNCAGVFQLRPFLDLTEADWDFLMGVNAKGLFFCVQAAAKVMLPRGRGSIVNISSVAGRGGRPVMPHYAASKAAVISVTRSAALAFGPFGIRVNAICPGVIDTPMWAQVAAERTRVGGREDPRLIIERIPLGRIGRPEEVAAVAAFLLSEDASYVNGQAINVCGGLELD
jgi:NAD(P)-dependent dehydrogenase (short-subunit alcohol dehydrogenase family)